MRLLWTIGLAMLCCTPELGETEELEEPLSTWAERQEAFDALDVLLDPKHPPTVGQACYYGGEPPLGRQAVDRLVFMGRKDLLTRALTAPSAEGRLYAAIGLARLGTLTWADVDARAAMEGPVKMCLGCTVSHASASEALGHYRALGGSLDE